MAKRILRIAKAHGTAHETTPAEWDKASPVKFEGIPTHDTAPHGGLVIKHGGKHLGKLHVRAADNGDLMLELDV